MKRSKIFILTLFALLLTATLAVAYVNWHNLTQVQKDDAILNRAYEDNGDPVGITCKQWVQRVVSEASSGHVSIPTTVASPNDYYWNYDPSGHVRGYSMAITNVKRADIIQMKNVTSGTPHTAIVVSKTTTGMTWIHCNWEPPFGQSVSVNFIPFSSFNSWYGNKYTVYHIE